MMESSLMSRVAVREIEGRDITVLSLLDSYLNYSSADDLKHRLKEFVAAKLDEGRPRFVVNLANVGVMDSCGLAVLISLKKLVDGRGGRLILSNLSAMIQRLFALTRLDRAFEVYPTEEAAIRAV
jgi:anti-sigma B factor antagonist